MRKLICVLLLSLNVLSACAFKLRDSNELPPGLHPLYLQTEEAFGRFETTLRASLRSSGIKLVATPAEASMIMAIGKPHLAYTIATIGTSNQSRVYNVVYTVSFALLTPKGAVLLPPQPLTATRDLTLSANQLIESNNQLSLLEQDMQRDVITQLYNRLSSQQLKNLLAHCLDCVPGNALALPKGENTSLP